VGVLRLFLALSVLDGYYQFFPSRIWLHGYVAVFAFFIISGFYMAMVLHEKYQGPGGVRLFYENRALRILPMWWLVIFLTTAGNAAGLLTAVENGNLVPNVFQASMQDSWQDKAVGLLTNITLVPSAAYVMYAALCGTDPGPWIVKHMFAGHMYTVALELLFYAIAPALMLLRGWRLAGAFAAALAVHFAPHFMGLPSRPYQYDVFPMVLALFLCGWIAFALYVRLRNVAYPRRLGWLGLVAVGVYCYACREPMTWDMTNRVEPWGLYVMLIGVVPLLFLASAKSGVDRFIGDLSYPVYAIQFMVIAWAEKTRFADTATRHWAAFGVIMAVAVAITLFFERPIDRFRHALARAGTRRG
jgi:peptidoglycan/LPS O-acetylase OafA/YrhL